MNKETRTELLDTPGGGKLRSAPLFLRRRFSRNVLNTEPGSCGCVVGGMNCMTKRQRSLCFSSICKWNGTNGLLLIVDKHEEQKVDQLMKPYDFASTRIIQNVDSVIVC